MRENEMIDMMVTIRHVLEDGPLRERYLLRSLWMSGLCVRRGEWIDVRNALVSGGLLVRFYAVEEAHPEHGERVFYALPEHMPNKD